MTGRFFIDWELWQQMTFCLACAIAVVFVVGFLKLWWNNRSMAKLELIDAEKRAHISEMESTGLPPQPKQSDIPFGVRAIQSGIEVDGIWISRPNTPATDTSSPPNSAKGKGKYVAQAPVSPASTNSDPFASPASSRASYGPQTYRPTSVSSHNRGTSQADALRALEGKPAPTTENFQTYQPRGSDYPPESVDDYGSPIDRRSVAESPYGVDVRVPIRPPPVNRHLSNARAGPGSTVPPPKMGGGSTARSFAGSIHLPSGARKPQAGDEFSDPFATPSRSPANTPGGGGHHVSFAPDEYIPSSHRQASDDSSGSTSTSTSTSGSSS